MHQTITCKLKSSGKRFFKTVKEFFKDSFRPKIMISPFLYQNLRMTGKSIQFAAKAVLMKGKRI